MTQRMATLVATAALISMAAASSHARTMCVPVEMPRDNAMKHGAHWEAVTPERYRFLEGIFALDPSTPQGLPPGDHAILSWKDGDSGASVWFIDGETACGPMDIPQPIVDMMGKLYEVKHIGQGL